MSPTFHFDAPDHFTAGTVGPPGQRVFHLQARQDGELVTLLLEKGQVAALAEYLSGMLADLAPVAPTTVPAAGDLLEPVQPAWRVGRLEVAFDDEADRIIVVAVEVDASADPTSPEAEPSTEADDLGRLRLRLTRAQVAAFIPHAVELIGQGRPPCPLCGRPLDPEGHVCPRSNGHRATG